MNNFGCYNLNVCPIKILIDEYVKLTDYGLKIQEIMKVQKEI